MGFYNNPYTLVSDLLNNNPFSLVSELSDIPFGSNVYIVSDEKYKELKQNQAREEIAVLERRLESYEEAATKLRDTIAALNEEHGLLPPPSTKDEVTN